MGLFELNIRQNPFLVYGDNVSLLREYITLETYALKGFNKCFYHYFSALYVIHEKLIITF